jgi:hypothetical protein
MKTLPPKLLFIFILLSCTLIGCSKRKDAALETALDELTRLASYAETGSFQQYEDRLLTTKGNIDVALQRSSDEGAKRKIGKALKLYFRARDAWKLQIEDISSYTGIVHSSYSSRATHATERASLYAHADESTRKTIDAEDEKFDEELERHGRKIEDERKAEQRRNNK